MLGLVLNLPGVWYLVALKDIAKGSYGTLTEVLLILLFNAIMFLMAEVPLVGYLVDPEATRRQVHRFQAWLSDNSRALAAIVAAVVGLYLAGRGIAGLA